MQHIGTSILRLIPAGQQDEEHRILEKMKLGESLTHIETLRQTKDRRMIDVSVTASPIRDASGQVIGVSKVVRDISERKRSEEALRSSQANLAIAQSIAHFGSWEIELGKADEIDASPLRWSDEMYRIAGYEPGAVAVSNALFFRLVPAAEHELIRQAIATAIRDRTQYTIVHRLIRPDGTERIVHEAAQIFWDEHTGRPVKIIGTAHDITARRKLEQQFQKAQKMESIGQLAGGIAHDFNNILGAIVGNLYLAQLDAAEHPAILAHLQNISGASQRATDLVKQILTFSRQTKPEREPLKLNHVVLEVLKLLRASLPAGIRIQIELAETPAVLANATAVHQVMMNLGTNAWHAMRDQNGVLKVEMKILEVDEDFAKTRPDLHPGKYVQLSVSDTGCGMDRHMLEHVFEPFFTTKPVGEGTGLGLAVVHGIMKSHDGGVSVYSQPGKGTRFNLYFPVVAGEVMAREIEAAPIPRGHGEHILFVDDEEALVKVGKKMLEHLGYAVTAKTSPLEAIALVRDQPAAFDLVITDLTMPGLDGMALGRRLLKIQPRLAIILSTGYSGLMTAEKVLELGFRELLSKPCTARVLAETVQRVLHPAAATKP